MKHLLPCVTTAWALTAALSPAQTTWIVASNGTGNFTSLDAAYAAAAPGDIILVRAGTYFGAVAQIGVTVLCDSGAVFQAAFNAGIEHGVRNLPAGQTFVFRGGTYVRFPHTQADVVVEDCRGAVVLDGLDVQAGPPSDSRVLRSDAVALHGVHVYELRIESSVASLSACDVEAPDFSPRDPALTVRSSRVGVAACHITHAGRPQLNPAGPALALGGAALVTIGGASVVDGLPAVVGTATDELRHDPMVQFRASAPPAIQGPLTVRTLSVPSVAADGVAAGQVFTVTTTAAPTSTTATHVDLPVPPRAIPPSGDLWIGAGAPAFDVGVVPPTGQRTASLVIPPIARGVPVVLQPVSLLASGQLVLGVPTFVVLN